MTGWVTCFLGQSLNFKWKINQSICCTINHFIVCATFFFSFSCFAIVNRYYKNGKTAGRAKAVEKECCTKYKMVNWIY